MFLDELIRFQRKIFLEPEKTITWGIMADYLEENGVPSFFAREYQNARLEFLNNLPVLFDEDEILAEVGHYLNFAFGVVKVSYRIGITKLINEKSYNKLWSLEQHIMTTLIETFNSRLQDYIFKEVTNQNYLRS